MNRLFVLSVLLSTCMFTRAQQLPGPPEPRVGEVYFTSGGELIFSWPVLDVNGSDQGAVVRFSAFFNSQIGWNYDFSKHFGTYFGLTIRNVGFIYQVPDTTLRYKYRTYSLGIPVGFKLGTMNAGLLYLGYEPMFALNYKEKRFENEKKEDKFNVWFSDRTPLVHHTVSLAFQFRSGATLSFKYYLNNFHNKDFSETNDGVTSQPYAGLNANLVYVSLGFDLFQADNVLNPGNFGERPDPRASIH